VYNTHFLKAKRYFAGFESRRGFKLIKKESMKVNYTASLESSLINEIKEQIANDPFKTYSSFNHFIETALRKELYLIKNQTFVFLDKDNNIIKKRKKR